MSNQILKSDLAATAHQRKAPLGLRKAVNQRKSSSFTTNSSTGMISSNNPILKPPTRRDNDSYDHDDRNLSEIDDKLLAFQNEVQQTENEQKARLEEDDDIVERRLQQVHEREEKIKASIAGEKIAVEDPLQKLPHHQMLLEKKQNYGDHDDDKDDNDENQKPSLIPKKVEDNLYTEAYYLREKDRQAKKQAKIEEEKAAKEQEAKERKRRGTLANLAIKMKLNPEKYEGVALPTTGSETKSEGTQDTASMKIPTPPPKE